VFIGLGDLSQSLGVTGEMSNPRLLDAAKQTLQTIVSSGRIAAMHAELPDGAKKWVELGAQVVCCGVDLNALRKDLLRVSSEFVTRRESVETR
jgi:4-hydroxy-2-oxoheptanedioate aldolase